jgi:hypothetical protein
MRNIDRLYRIAENQAGYFTAQQARGVGYSWERLSQNVKNDCAGYFAHPGQYLLKISVFAPPELSYVLFSILCWLLHSSAREIRL